MDYENKENFEYILKTALALIQQRGGYDLCNLIVISNWQVINTNYDNWNGGTYGYTVYIKIPVKQYASFKSEQIKDFETIFADTLNEVTKTEENIYFSVQISPIFCKSDIEWNLIGGAQEKNELKNKIEEIKDIMISVSTGGDRINDDNNRYRTLHTEIKQTCIRLNITYNNNFTSLWDWFKKYKADFHTYQSRREFIEKLFNPTLVYFEGDIENFSNENIVQLDDWERLKRTIIKIKKNSFTAKNEEDFQSIGLLCRECIISLAQAVYNQSTHGEYDDTGTKIGNTDAIRMIGNYLNVKLRGKENEEIRAYAKCTNKLANMLTHKRSASKKDMLLTTSATIALINLIGILEEKYI